MELRGGSCEGKGKGHRDRRSGIGRDRGRDRGRGIARERDRGRDRGKELEGTEEETRKGELEGTEKEAGERDGEGTEEETGGRGRDRGIYREKEGEVTRFSIFKIATRLSINTK